MCVCNVPIIEIVDLESSILVHAGTSSENVILCMTRSSGQGQGHRNKDACLFILLESGLNSIERQSCLLCVICRLLDDEMSS